MDKLTQRLERTTEDGNYVADAAAKARQDLRRSTKPGNADREQKLDDQIRQINEVMEDVRSLVAKSLWDAFPEKLEQDLRDVSARLQYQRRQLKKMRRHDR